MTSEGVRPADYVPPRRYRKRPVVIDAIRLTGMNGPEVAEWCGGEFTGSSVHISTLEGRMTAQWGDWIIRGVKGEFYPCKPDIFAVTYEAVDGPHIVSQGDQ